jgi:O-antigen/teichoic acid export membrane protein
VLLHLSSNLVANLFCRAAFFLFMLAVIKQMSTIEYGRVTYFLSMGNSITSIASGGLGTLLVANLSRYDDVIFQQKLLTYASIFLLGSILIVPSIYQLTFDNEFSFALIVFYTACLCAKTFGENSLLGLMKTKQYFQVRLGEGFFYLLGLISVLLPTPYISVDINFVVTVLVLATLPSIVRISIDYGLPSLHICFTYLQSIRKSFAGIARKHFFLFMSQVVAAPGIFILLDQVEKTQLNARFELGVYGAFYQWYAPLVMVTGVVSNALLPILVRKKTQITNNQVLVISCVSISACIGGSMYFSNFITSFYGPEYLERLLLFKLMMFAAGMHALNNVLNSLMLANFSEKFMLIFELIWASILLCVGFLYVSTVGVQAVALAILIAYSIVVVGKTVMLLRYSNA